MPDVIGIETEHGEVTTEPSGNWLSELQIASALLQIRMGYADRSLYAAIAAYLTAVKEFEARGGGGSYSVVELPKLDIADALLTELKLPTAPTIPEPKPAGPPTSPSYRKTAIPTVLRWQVWERDNFTCQECGARRHLTIDHIIAEVKGGPTILENLQTLCAPCNSRKGAK